MLNPKHNPKIRSTSFTVEEYSDTALNQNPPNPLSMKSLHTIGFAFNLLNIR